MKIFVDASVFSVGGGSFGRLSGILELVEVPSVGDQVALIRSIEGGGTAFPAAFAGALKVEGVRFKPLPSEVVASLSLEDLILPTAQDCREMAKYLDQGFGLWIEEF